MKRRASWLPAIGRLFRRLRPKPRRRRKPERSKRRTVPAMAGVYASARRIARYKAGGWWGRRRRRQLAERVAK